MKTVFDQITGHYISIAYHPSTATAIMACNGKWETEVIPPDSRSIAQIAYSKSDLESFGRLFE